jgi:osmotically-inducible protein OsmY
MFNLLAKIGLGVAAMYFLDPDGGNRRRHLAADRARKAFRRGRRELEDTITNTKNHAKGVVHELRGTLHAEPVDDNQLVDRVRAELGHHVERARDIEVVSENNIVTLSGDVPADQLTRAQRVTEMVRGVERVEIRPNSDESVTAT